MAEPNVRVPEIRPRTTTRNQLKDFLTRLFRTKPLGTVCGVVVLVFFLVAVFAGLLAPYGFNEQFRTEFLDPPSLGHWFGTDNIGRDIFSRIIYGARVTMLVGVVGSATSLVVSVVIGLPSGYFGGKFDIILQRFIDAWLVFPGLILLILLVAILGPGLWNIVFIL